jgi:peptide chain release factor 1
MPLNADMTGKLAKAAEEYESISDMLSNPAVLSNNSELKRLSRRISELEPLATSHRRWKAMAEERSHLEEAMASADAELAEMARQELSSLAAKEQVLERDIQAVVEESERDPNDSKGSILEVRAGTGGDEAALFASEMLRMYLRLAERRGWKTEVIDMSRTELGGLREAVVSIDGKDVWKWMKYEGGVHRVQRVPVTEAAGRIHTSAVSVVSLPQAEEIDVEMKPEDLRIDTFCSSGAGGQSVNTTYSAVRIVHVPTGITVQCQDERSQAKNKAKALKVLRARLLAADEDRKRSERSQARKEQVRSGDRSEKIRTYNFPQNRVTDHRAGCTIYRLPEIMDGDMEELLRSVSAGIASNPTGAAAEAD